MPDASRSNELLESITALQRAFIRHDQPAEVFDGLLATFLDATGSEYGFIGEVLRDAQGAPYLKTHAITNIAWTDDLRAWFDREAPQGLEFRNLETLFGAAITSGEIVVTNTPEDDDRAGGIPEGHPPLNSFLAMPLHGSSGMVGLVGLANRPGGYHSLLIAELEPLLTTTSVLVDAHRNDRAEAEAQEELRRSAEILDNTPDFVGWADAQGQIVHINHGGRKMVGLGESVDLGSRLVGTLAPDWAAKLIREEAIPSAIADGVWTGESAYLDPTGREIPVSQVVIAHRDERGDVRYVSTIARDISERFELDRMKDDFVSMVSHELRTPLTSIVGYTEVLADNDAGELSEAQEGIVETIGRNAERLLSLIDDLLALSSLGQRDGGPSERIDLVEVVGEQIDALRPVADSKQIDLRAESTDPTEVQGRLDQLERVVANLLSNALKFTPRGGRVTIDLRTDGDLVELTVTDTGIGIPADEQANLFERFHRASNAQRDAIQGSGLGLAISREIVEAHGGSIELVSEVGSGTAVAVRLPAASAPEHRETP